MRSVPRCIQHTALNDWCKATKADRYGLSGNRVRHSGQISSSEDVRTISGNADRAASKRAKISTLQSAVSKPLRFSSGGRSRSLLSAFWSPEAEEGGAGAGDAAIDVAGDCSVAALGCDFCGVLGGCDAAADASTGCFASLLAAAASGAADAVGTAGAESVESCGLAPAGGFAATRETSDCEEGSDCDGTDCVADFGNSTCVSGKSAFTAPKVSTRWHSEVRTWISWGRANQADQQRRRLQTEQLNHKREQTRRVPQDPGEPRPPS